MTTTDNIIHVEYPTYDGRYVYLYDGEDEYKCQGMVTIEPIWDFDPWADKDIHIGEEITALG